MGRLENRVAVVTGAGGGIGSAIASRFVEEGAAVVLTDVSEAAVQAAADALCDRGGAAVGLRHDVTDSADWARVLGLARERFGGIDILVNNAGLAHVASIEDATFEDWRRIMAVNLDGVFLGTQAAVAEMRGRGGSIINMSSIRAMVSNPSTVVYDASKAAVAALTRSAALHCARQGYAIRINSVHPGYILTDMVQNVFNKQSDPDAVRDQVMAAQPIGRMGRPMEIADAVLFLASDESSFMIGSQLVVDGGYTAQ